MEALLERLEQRLEGARNPERALGTAQYMRNQFAYYGISSPALRAIARDVLADERPPDESRLRAIADAYWKRDEREWQYFACSYVRTNIGRASPRFLSAAKELITTKSWWDTVDTLAAHTVGALVAATPKLGATMDEWIDSENMWVVRTAILHQLTYKRRTNADRLFDYCLRRSVDTEFFIRKAIGWALREYSKSDPDAVQRFVTDNERRLSGLSKREALKRIERGKSSSRARSFDS